ncbi:MAG: amidohydrolase [Candidatus Krumholzibacteria bacterium]|nr:amidohydrolase [Candidatus Krumholzibacteria bacterium]
MKSLLRPQLAALALVRMVGTAGGQAPPEADLIVTGTIVTMTRAAARAEAVAVRDGRIMYVGDEAGARAHAGASTRWIDARGVVLPGLVDAHGHLRNLGRLLHTLQLTGTRSKEAVVARVREAQAESAPGQWIYGRGWDQNDWEAQAFPTWQDLEGTGANPVYLRRVDGHAAWVNRAALEIAGVTRDTPDPPGGRILRDARGEPTGVLVDKATDLVYLRIPEPSDQELDAWMRSAVVHCNEAGLTGVHDAGTGRRVLDSLRRLARAGALTLRVYAMLDADEPDLIDAQLAAGPSVELDGYLTIRAVKAYADGALGSRGAALLEPYSDEPSQAGLVITTPDSLRALSARAAAAGFQMCTHAIGDRGNRMALDAYAAVFGGPDHDGRRFRVEHCQVLAPDDIPRFAALGVIASMQPAHATSDMYWAEARVGGERIRGAYAWRTLLDSGAALAFGSDFPVESVSPLLGIHAAAARQDAEGWPEGGWYPEQRLSVEEAVRAFTVGAAYAAFQEAELGTIAVGRRADLTVLDRDIFAAPAAEILAVRVDYTIVGGAIVYEAP